MAKTKGRGTKHPKQAFFESFDVNRSGSLEQEEALRFAATWYDVEGLLRSIGADAEVHVRIDDETAAMHSRFLDAFLDHIDAPLPIPLMSFLAVLRSGPPDNDEKKVVQKMWQSLVHEKEVAAQKVLDAIKAAKEAAARRAALATM